jgi:hypothetical protein
MYVKGKVHPGTGHEGPGIEVYLYSFFNLGARWGMGNQRHSPAALPPG